MRRRRITSQLPAGRPSTMTSPLLGVSKRLISLSVVVLPEPLRPSRTRVSPRCTSSLRSWRSSRPPSPFTLYAALRNSMAGRELGESFIDACSLHFSFALRGLDALGRAGETQALQNFVGRWRQAGDANSGMAFVPDVQSDQERGDLLKDARVFQFAAIDCAHTRDFYSQVAGDLVGVRIIAADNYVAIDRAIGIQRLRSEILKSGYDRDAFRDKFRGLLRGGALPDAEGASGATADTCGQRHGGVDHDGAGRNRRLDLFEQSGLAFEGNR